MDAFNQLYYSVSPVAMVGGLIICTFVCTMIGTIIACAAAGVIVKEI